MSPFDRARRALSVYVGLRFWSLNGRIVVGFTKCLAFFPLFFARILDFSVICGGVREKVNSAFHRTRRALSVCVGLRFWSPQWGNRDGVYEQIWDFGGISQFCGI